MKEVRFHPRVPGEVRKIISYYEEIAPELAEDFWLELNEAIRSAQVNPERHHFDPSGSGEVILSDSPIIFSFRFKEQGRPRPCRCASFLSGPRATLLLDGPCLSKLNNSPSRPRGRGKSRGDRCPPIASHNQNGSRRW